MAVASDRAGLVVVALTDHLLPDNTGEVPPVMDSLSGNCQGGDGQSPLVINGHRGESRSAQCGAPRS
jgi:hypothetical protein